MANVHHDLPSGLNRKTTNNDMDGDLEKPSSGVSEEKGDEAQQLENVQPTTKTVGKRQRCRNHCARFWLWWLVGVVVFLAVLLPCLFLKIIPAIIQDIINNTDLPILNAEMGAKSETELEFSFSTVFNAPGSMTARMDSFNLSMYNTFTEGFYPYTYVTLPTEELKGSTSITINSTSSVLNYTEISKWLNATFYGETTEISFRGATTIHFGALHAPIDIKKTVTVAGLDQLKGFSLDSSRLVLPAEPDGTNLVGNLTLPNPGTVAIKFGDLTFNASVAGIVIGNVSVSDVVLVQGNNTVPFRGQILLDTVVDNLNTILGNSSSASNGTVEMAISGGSCTVDGEHITYVESVLDSSVMYAPVPLEQLIQEGLSSVMGTNSTEALRREIDSLLEADTTKGIYGRDSNDASAAKGARLGGNNAVQESRDLVSDRTSDVAKAARLYQRLTTFQQFY